MIEIKFGEHMVEARGHAGSAPAGSDLVCASVSVIIMALRLGLAELEGCEVGEWDISPGNGHVEAKSVPPEGVGMFVMAETALRYIAEAYPEYVKII